MKNKIEGIPQKVLVKKLLGYFYPYLGQCILLTIVVVISLGATLLQPMLWSKLLAALFAREVENLSKILFSVVILYLITVGVGFVQSIITSYLNAKVVCDMQNQLFRKMLSMNMAYFDKTQTGAFIARIITDISQVVDAVTKQIVPALINLIKVVVIFFIMIRINMILALITVGLLPITLFVYSKNTKKMRNKQTNVKKSNDQIVSMLQQSVSGIKSIKTLGIKNIEAKLFENKNQEKTLKVFNFAIFVVFFQTVLSLIGMFGEVSVYMLGGYFVLQSIITVERFIQFASYSQQFGNSSLSLVNLVADYQKVLVSLRRLYDIEDISNNYHEEYGTHVLSGNEGHIDIYNILKCNFKFQLAGVNSICLEITPAHIIAMLPKSILILYNVIAADCLPVLIGDYYETKRQSETFNI